VLNTSPSSSSGLNIAPINRSKKSVSLGYITVKGERKMEKGRGRKMPYVLSHPPTTPFPHI
jgi:hypothetical protein